MSFLQSMQQTQTFKWQRPDAMINQGVASFDNVLTFKKCLVIIGGSIGTGTALWSLAHAKQKASELKFRSKRRANDANLREQRSVTPLVIPVIKIQAARQKPPIELGTVTPVEVNRPVGRDIGNYITTFLPDEKFAKEHHKKLAAESQAELDAVTTHNANLKRMAWGIPLFTLGIIGKINDVRKIILCCNDWILTPIVDLTLNLKQGEFRKAAKPLMWCGIAYLVVRNRGLIRRAILGF